MKAAERRSNLREDLVAAAERAIAARGLSGIKARELAAEAGCALGAIYNVFGDLDDLAIAVNGRTLGALERALADVRGDRRNRKPGADAAVRELVAMATIYLDFAARNTLRWRALFDHRLSEGKSLPDWYLADQIKLFGYVEGPLRALKPGMKPAERALLARSLFSAVHGLITLGLEEKLGVVPADVLRKQVVFVTTALGRGLIKL